MPLADAARAVHAVVANGRSADAALAPFDTHPQRAAIRAIALGTLRWYLRLAPAVDMLLAKPQAVSAEVRALLVTSAHQIEYSRNVPQATVHAAVDAARILRQDRASSLVNAVLRRFVAERPKWFERVDRDLPGRTAHPKWLVERLAQTWAEQYVDMLTANNQHPPMVLRVDLARVSVDAYLGQLASASIGGHALPWAPAAVQLDEPVPVLALPGFSEGVVSVQDAGAQLAAVLLDAQPGMRVLDACAAPGGKTAHILQRTPDLAELVAVDIDPDRVARIRENLDRLSGSPALAPDTATAEAGRTAPAWRSTVRLVVADVRQTLAFRQHLPDARPFDRILVDAPCSSTGVIRRHPDIKLLRRPDDIPAFAKAQLEILRSSFGLLAVGGRLVYCTCSVLPEENDGVLGQFLQAEPGAQVVAASGLCALPPGAVARASGIQLLPGSEAGSDGFYYACVEKTTAGT